LDWPLVFWIKKVEIWEEAGRHFCQLVGRLFNTQYFADLKEKVIGILKLKQTQGTNSDNTGWRFRQLVSRTIDD
ncbi:MAG: hypothetical protein IPF70_13150, partial [Saprospiraceae bacterium]|nr:hypothetical protein [Saprospiraceae bacterium]